MTQFHRIRHTRAILAAAAFAGVLTAGGAHAQGYAGPGTGAATGAATKQQGYAGPSSVAVVQVQELAANGRDDQNAILRGRIVSYDGDDHYSFEDASGKIRVEIDDEDFPAGQKIDDKTMVELHGELDRDRKGVEFDVDEIRIL